MMVHQTPSIQKLPYAVQYSGKPREKSFKVALEKVQKAPS